jgi:hypothetical protein
MKVFAFLVLFGLFLGGFALFGYAFTFPEGLNAVAFVGGIAAIAVALMIPFHLLEKFD